MFYVVALLRLKHIMPMINVGILTAHHFPRMGGMEFVTHFLAEHLNKRENVNVSIACNSLRGIPKDFKYPYNCYRAKSLSYLTPWLFRKNQLNMIKKEQVNILHGPMLHGGGKWASKFSKQLNLPFVAHSHGSDVQIVKEIGYGALLNSDSKKSIIEVTHRADKLLAVSSINKNNMIELGVNPNKIVVIHNGIQVDEINNISYQNVRPGLTADEDDFVIVTVGRNRPVKRMELLFEALKKLKDYKKIKCVCVGPKENLGQLAEKYNILDKVILKGSIPAHMDSNSQPPYPNLINTYRSANVYISTSYVEAFSGAASDALACGIPIIIGKKHGVKDIILPNETGWIMPKETPESLAELILNLYEKREKLLSKKQIIKESVSHLTWQNIAKQTESVYKSIL